MLFDIVRRRPARGLAPALAAAMGLAFVDRHAAAADASLDWCAPVVVRPDQQFDNWKSCNPVWSQQEIAQQADVVLMSADTTVSKPRRPPHPITCWGDATYAKQRAYIEEVNALRPVGRRKIDWLAQVRFDLVSDNLAALPGFDHRFLVRTRRPWSSVLDFFRLDRSGACPDGGCTWSDAWGAKDPCDGQCLRDYIDASGGPGTHEKVVYYVNLTMHPRYFPSAALARQDDPEYRKWIIQELRHAIDDGGATLVHLNQKFWQWHPKSETRGIALGAPAARDVAALRRAGAAFTGEPDGYGYPQYVAGWVALAKDLHAAGVPFAVNLGRTLWTSRGQGDDPATPGVDEAAAVRDVAERLATLVLVEAQGMRSGAEEVAQRLRAKGRRVVVVDPSCPISKKAR